ncbi:MAG: 2-C-methyl-D-erythritol 4-phosphate cytidylyltransferase [bacterium]
MLVSAIIVAAGSGLRMGGAIPKQFQLLEGLPILYYTLKRFEACNAVDEVVIVAAKEWLSFVSQEIVDRFNFTKVRKIVAGGLKRQDSVYCGIKALVDAPDITVVHDAVRPFVTPEKITEAVTICKKHAGVILAVPPKDTIKVEKAGFVEKTPARDILRSVQTPQVFKHHVLRQAHEKAIECGIYLTDDSALVERLGYPVKIIEGDDKNIKITEPYDLKLAEVILNTD